MAVISANFRKQALGPLLAGKINDSESESDADSIDNLALEPELDPYKSLMKKVGRLLESGMDDDLIEAHELLQTSLASGRFNGMGAGKIDDLLDKYDEIREKIAENPALQNILGDDDRPDRKMLKKINEPGESSIEYWLGKPQCQWPEHLKPGMAA